MYEDYVCRKTGITTLEIVGFIGLEMFRDSYRTKQIIELENNLEKYVDGAEKISDYFRKHLSKCEDCQAVYHSRNVPALAAEVREIDEVRAEWMKFIVGLN